MSSSYNNTDTVQQVDEPQQQHGVKGLINKVKAKLPGHKDDSLATAQRDDIQPTLDSTSGPVTGHHEHGKHAQEHRNAAAAAEQSLSNIVPGTSGKLAHKTNVGNDDVNRSDNFDNNLNREDNFGNNSNRSDNFDNNLNRQDNLGSNLNRTDNFDNNNANRDNLSNTSNRNDNFGNTSTRDNYPQTTGPGSNDYAAQRDLVGAGSTQQSGTGLTGETSHHGHHHHHNEGMNDQFRTTDNNTSVSNTAPFDGQQQGEQHRHHHHFEQGAGNLPIPIEEAGIQPTDQYNDMTVGGLANKQGQQGQQPAVHVHHHHHAGPSHFHVGGDAPADAARSAEYQSQNQNQNQNRQF